MTVTTYQGDCLEVMKDIPDKSIDLVVMDPPYFRVMKEDTSGNKYDWDDQWDSLQDYIDWMDNIFTDIQRICKPTASIYCFADDLISAHIQIPFERHFNILNNIIWYKTNPWSLKGWSTFRRFVSSTEHILFGEMIDQGGASLTGLERVNSDHDCFTDLRNYLTEGKKKAMENNGWNTTQFNEWINGVTGKGNVASRHYFCESQWTFPTEELYERMKATGYWRRSYEELRQSYENMRRSFSLESLMTNVWTYPIVPPNSERIHPTQKPLDMIERIVSISAPKEGMVVFDPFMGSGTTGVASVQRGCDFIGIEKDDTYYAKAVERISKAEYKAKGRTTLDSYIEVDA